ncbi:MAG: bifunctional glutamate N-acetyltransferase/amino-acid acetyltransferase ArgJ [Alphaproteobacteria bacterium]|nr:bifunctional glutamate N-acetyltransferase/amino-acid acetyltransferase ArgJ [Alphaproteobacteria bacterium]
MPPKSPLAPAQFPAMPPIPGVRLAAGACGVRYRGRTDVLLAELAPGTSAAGVLTRSLTASAPVDWCRRGLKTGRARALVVNSGNANAFTGRSGVRATTATATATAKLFGCARGEVFLASTGVIGEPLPAERIVAGLPQLQAALRDASWPEAAAAIMTTDTFPKGASRTARIGGATVTINGIAKGSGMIAPDMATMLAFVFTDARLPSRILQRLLRDGADRSFNSMTVDSDTSTSDTLLLFATGLGAAHPRIASASDPRLKDFRKKFDEVLLDLALQVVRDGEGAQKLIRVDVTGAASPQAARRIGLSIANSPLVKTAIAGEDANWGRIVMAVGKAGEKASRDRMRIRMGGITIAARGERVVGYDEGPIAVHMKGREIAIEVDVGVGRAKATVWTCDLTHGYIDINADYRS